MHWMAITTLVVSVGTSALMAIGAREHHQKLGQMDVYRFPSVYFYFFLFASALFATVPFWPGITGGQESSLIAFGIFALLPLIGAYYFRKYRLVIDGPRVMVGAFRKRQFEVSDIAHLELQVGRGAELRLRLHDGTKVNVSGLVTDFDELAQSISARKP